jgi:hypothetical protein
MSIYSSYIVDGNQSYTTVHNAIQKTDIVDQVDSIVVGSKLPSNFVLANSPVVGELPLANPTVADIDLTQGGSAAGSSYLQSFVAPGFLLIRGAGMTANRFLTLGADTAANAAYLIQNLGLTEGSPSRLLEFRQIGAAMAAYTLSISNTSGTSNYVQFQTAGGAVSSAQPIYAASTLGWAYVIAQRLSPTSIIFNVVYSP